MEKGNELATGGVQMASGANGGAAAAAAGGGSPSSTDPGTGTGTKGAPPQAGGGGQQADQSGPQAQSGDPGTSARREMDRIEQRAGGHLPQQEGVSPKDGSNLRHDGQGGVEYLEYEGGMKRTIRLEGDRWVDTATGEPVTSEIAERAAKRLSAIFK